MPTPLTDRDHAMLDFERDWWKFRGSKEQAIRDTFGMSATRYWQALNALIDTPAALVADPVLVRRLQRVRTQRLQQRGAARRLASC